MQSLKVNARPKHAWRPSWHIALWTLACVFGRGPFNEAIAQTATATTLNYSENFTKDTFKNSIVTTAVGWPSSSGVSSPARTTFQAGSGIADNSATGSLSGTVLASAAGRIGAPQADSDDLVVISQSVTCRLLWYPFKAPTASSAAALNDNPVVIDTLTGCNQAAAIAVGDINQDGLDDVVVVTIDDPNGAGTVASATVYLNTNAGQSWQPMDMTSALQSANVAWHGPGNPMTLADINNDGALDLVALATSGTSQSVRVFAGSPYQPSAGFSQTAETAISSMGLATPIAQAGQQATGGDHCMQRMGVISRGATGIAVADLNGDGYLDVVVAEPDQALLHLYLGQSSGGFAPGPGVTLPPGSGQSVWARDVNFDGYMDLMVLHGAHSCGTPAGGGYVLNNLAGNANFIAQTFVAQPPNNSDIVATPLSQTLFSNATAMPQGSAWMTFGPSSGSPMTTTPYGYQPAYASKNIYNVAPRAQSTDVFNGAGKSQGMVLSEATVTNFTSQVAQGTQVKVSLSPDNGVTFETLTADELAGKSAHAFSHAGSQLVWRAEFIAAAAPLTGSDTTFAPGTKKLSTLTSIAIKATLLPGFTYSRAKAISATWKTDGTPKDYFITAAAQVPTFYGLLTAVPLSGFNEGTATSYQTITTNRNTASPNRDAAGASTQVAATWNAGALLAKTSGDGRMLYGSVVNNQRRLPSYGGLSATSLTRVNLSSDELNLPHSNPSLQSTLELSNSTKQNVLLFLRNGMNDPTNNKLYDPGHSSPVFLGAPTEDPNFMGAGYAAFQSAQSDRTPILLVGSNGGMLHAFDATTGREKWGFTPRNLMGKLKDQAVYVPGHQGSPGKTVYSHHYFVDGPITLGDVYSGSWHTVAIVGQGAGVGSDGNNYYFAIDVTNPAAPTPLWEVTQAGVDIKLTCDGGTHTPQTPQCGGRTDLQCCPYQQGYFCAPTSTGCAAPAPSMGQSLSEPAIGRLKLSGGNAVWAAFFASGYAHQAVPNIGRTIYAVNAFTGAPLGTWNLPDVAFAAGNPNILPTVPAGVKLVDADGDGYVDRLYVGDLGGRMWKLNTSKAIALNNGSMVNPNQYTTCLVYDAGAGSGTQRVWAPIVSSAGVAVMGPQAVNLYFGTGGDDAAPSDQQYTFYGIRDRDALEVCSNDGHKGRLIETDGELKIQDPTPGYRFWAEPTLVNGTTLYFASFVGSLEHIQDLADINATSSHLYGIAVRPFTDSNGNNYRAGQSVVTSGGNNYYSVPTALRTAPVVRGLAPTSVVRAVDLNKQAFKARDVLIQGGGGGVLRLSSTGGVAKDAAQLVQIRWRKVVFPAK